MTRGMLTAAIGLAVAVTGSCNLPPMISDTGCRGTWRRNAGPIELIAAITEVEGRWYFRWTRISRDGSQKVTCAWNGPCEERLNGKIAATYAITTRFDDARHALAIDTIEERVYPSKKTVRSSEILEVTDSGRTLLIFTTDRDGQHFEGGARPRRAFSKVADSVADPPRAVRP